MKEEKKPGICEPSGTEVLEDIWRKFEDVKMLLYPERVNGDDEIAVAEAGDDKEKR